VRRRLLTMATSWYVSSARIALTVTRQASAYVGYSFITHVPSFRRAHKRQGLPHLRLSGSHGAVFIIRRNSGTSSNSWIVGGKCLMAPLYSCPDESPYHTCNMGQTKPLSCSYDMLVAH
jgi:hypothetical protein